MKNGQVLGNLRLLARPWGTRWLGGLLISSAAVFAFWPVLTWDPSQEIVGAVSGIEAEFFSASGGSPLLVLVLAGWLVWRRRAALALEIEGAASRWIGGAVLAAAALLYLWAHFVRAPELLVPTFSLTIIGAGVFVAGRRAARILWFPALFALIAFPVPVALANLVLYPLQIATGKTAGFLLSAFGVPNAVVADLIFARSHVFQVIETCAGLASIQTYVMGTAIYVELFYRSRSQAVLLLALSPLVSFFFNALRVGTIVLNPYSEFAAVHTIQGMAMLFVGMFAIAGLDWMHARVWLGRSRPGSAVPSDSRDKPTAISTNATMRCGMAALLLATMPLISSRMPTWEPSRRQAPVLSTLPTKLGDWTARNLPLDRLYMGSVRFSEWTHRRYTLNNEHVEIFVGADDHMDRLKGLISEKTALLESGWEILEKTPVTLLPGQQNAHAYVLRSRTETRIAYHWYEGIGSAYENVLRSAIVLDRSPFGNPRKAAKVVRLSTPIGPLPHSRAKAEARLRQFMELLNRASGQRETG